LIAASPMGEIQRTENRSQSTVDDQANSPLSVWEWLGAFKDRNKTIAQEQAIKKQIIEGIEKNNNILYRVNNKWLCLKLKVIETRDPIVQVFPISAGYYALAEYFISKFPLYLQKLVKRKILD